MAFYYKLDNYGHISLWSTKSFLTHKNNYVVIESCYYTLHHLLSAYSMQDLFVRRWAFKAIVKLLLGSPTSHIGKLCFLIQFPLTHTLVDWESESEGSVLGFLPSWEA